MPFLARRRDWVVPPRVLCIDARLSARRIQTTATWSSSATMLIEVDLLLFVLSTSVPPRSTNRQRGSAQDTLRRSRGVISFKNHVSVSAPPSIKASKTRTGWRSSLKCRDHVPGTLAHFVEEAVVRARFSQSRPFVRQRRAPPSWDRSGRLRLGGRS